MCIPTRLRSPLVAAAVREHCVRQTADGVQVDVVADDELDEAGLAAALEESLRTAGLAAPRATVRRVEAIDRNPTSGKTRRFIPLAPA